MASRDIPTRYNIKKGRAVIIKINEFDDKRIKPFKGYEKDAKNIEEHLKELQFTTESNNNLKKTDMKRYLREEQLDEEHQRRAEILGRKGIKRMRTKTEEMVRRRRLNSVASQTCFDCFIGVILSHGGRGTIQCKDGPIDVSTILAPFKAAAKLHGKPKIFIIQACRGLDYDGGALGVEGDGDEERPYKTWLPVEADFLVAYSTMDGYVSLVTEEGSFFIHNLCQAIDEYIIHRDSTHPPVDLMTILTRVNLHVAELPIKAMAMGEICLKKQMPCVVSTLRKDIFLQIKNTPDGDEMES